MRKDFYDSIFINYDGNWHGSMGWCSWNYFTNLDGKP